MIPTTTDKYVSFCIGDIFFKDSYAFTQSSLESLSGNLSKEKFVNLRQWVEKRVAYERDINPGDMVSGILILIFTYFLLHLFVFMFDSKLMI